MKTVFITKEHLRQIAEAEKNTPAAQDQVHNKVNAGIMDAVTCGGMMEGAEPESNEYVVGVEKDGEYKHVCEEEQPNVNSNDETLKKYMKKIADFMYKQGMNVKPLPKLELDWSDQEGLFIKTGYYDPNDKKVVVFCASRNDKDILRSFAHEMIHHAQNLDGKNLSFSGEDNVKDSKELEKIEAEAYLKGNILFRKWTEFEQDNSGTLNEGKSKQKKQVFNDEGKLVPEKCEKCGSDVGVYICGEPVYKCTKCGEYYGTVPFPDNLNENTVSELDSDEVDLSSFRLKQHLNPKFWKDGKLDSRIRMKLLDIADDFIETLGISWVKPKDIIMTGSLANYNWNSSYSDIDLHVLVDFAEVDERKDFVEKYFKAQKDVWNEKHGDITIYGFPVEVYVQDINEKHNSSGVYSLERDEWCKTPDREKMASSKINIEKIKHLVAMYATKIDKLYDIYKNSEGDEYKIRKVNEKADALFDEIKNERRGSLKDSDSEITTGNLIFKCLRRMDYIDKLSNLKSKSYDALQSINESNDNNFDFNVYVMCGCAGSGKSTWIKNNLPGIPVVSRDVIRTELGYCGEGEKYVGTNQQENNVNEVENKLIEKLCNAKVDFAVDNMNIKPKYRKNLISKLKQYNAKIIMVVMDTNIDACKQARNGQIPDDVMDRMHKTMSFPEEGEYDEIITVKR